MIFVLAGLVAVPGCSRPPAQAKPITVAIPPLESVAPVYVAEDQKMFDDNGLRVTYRECDTGVKALDAVLAGEADIAVGTAEIPLVRAAFEGAPISAIASIDRPDFIYLVGRKDKGIEKAADLKGKRVGTNPGSAAQFHLGRFLEVRGMAFSDITYVPLATPEEWRAAIKSGDVDAVVLAQPEASYVKKELGDNAVFLPVQGSQPIYTLAIAKNDWIAENPESVKRFLTTLAQSEEFIGAKPAEARRIIQKRLKLDADYMDRVEEQNAFALGLDQSLIVAMEDQARWLIRNHLTTATAMPDFTEFIDATALEQVEPDAVNLMR